MIKKDWDGGWMVCNFLSNTSACPSFSNKRKSNPLLTQWQKQLLHI